MEIVTKSRNLPLSEFYTILQQEFISYFVRSKIYPAEYAVKYERYCVCKKEKIDRISVKNNLPSIFNDPIVKDRFLEKFFNPYALPNFEYRDENSIRMMGRWDKLYWFGEGVSVKVKVGSETVLTTIIKNMPHNQSIVASINGEVKSIDYSFVTRLIGDSLVVF